MNTKFVEGTVLLYFKDDDVGLVILDEISKKYFILIDYEDKNFDYGRKIKIKYLNKKYFKKLANIETTNHEEDWLEDRCRNTP